MGLLGMTAGGGKGPRPAPTGGTIPEFPRLIVRTRCEVVADLVTIEPDGTPFTVVSGLKEEVARDLYREMTGHTWTSDEAGRLGQDDLAPAARHTSPEAA